MSNEEKAEGVGPEVTAYLASLTDAQLVDHCSSVLEMYGAQPVPRAQPGFTLPDRLDGAPRRCPRCRHGVTSHGVAGHCFAGTCRCGWTP